MSDEQPVVTEEVEAPVVDAEVEATAAAEAQAAEEAAAAEVLANESPEDRATREAGEAQAAADAEKATKEENQKQAFKRIDRDRQREREARIRAEAKLEAMQESSPTQQANQPPTRPNRADFADDPDGYTEAAMDYSEYLANKRTEPTGPVNSFEDRQEAARAEIADYDEVVTYGPKLNVPDAAVAAIRESEHGPAICYLLGKEPELVKQVNGAASPLATVRAIGRIEARIEAEKTKAPAKAPVTKAKPPLKPAVGGGKTVVDTSKMTDAQWWEHEKNEKRKKFKG